MVALRAQNVSTTKCITVPSYLLLAALYSPVWTSGIHSSIDFAIGLVAFLALMFWRAPPWLVVVGGAATASLTGA